MNRVSLARGSAIGQTERLAELRFALGHASSNPADEVAGRFADPAGGIRDPFTDGLRSRLLHVLPNLDHNEDCDARAKSEPQQASDHQALRLALRREPLPRMALR